MARRILSVASAPGWSARIEQPVGEDRLVTLAAWALVEDGDATALVGLVQAPAHEGIGTFKLADEVEAFAGYSFGGLRTRVERS